MNKNQTNPFKAGSQYPGQRLGMDLNAVRKDIIFMPKVYGQSINVVAGSNPNNVINLPRDGQKMIGISIYYNYPNAVDNPELTLNVNNTIYIDGVGLRALDINNLGSQIFIPLAIPLSGNDRITVSLDDATNQNRLFVQFYYM